MYKYVLFDLDGTLTDSKEGIIKSVAYALEQMGESTEGRLDQHTIVGPPLLTTFEDVYGFSPEKARQTYAYFQERYSTIGKFEKRHRSHAQGHEGSGHPLVRRYIEAPGPCRGDLPEIRHRSLCGSYCRTGRRRD